MEYEGYYGQVQKLKYDCLLFDLDDTLYPLSSGISTELLKNISGYMVEKLGIEKSKIPDLCNLLYKNYGTTLAGLRAIGYELDYDEYHKYVHGKLPYENIKPDPVLRSLLLSLPYRKVIFTNADKDHTAKVLERLGLEDCFEGLICFETLNPTDTKIITNYVNGILSNGLQDDLKFPGLKPYNDIFDIIGHFARPEPRFELPKTPVICKPSEQTIEMAIKIAGINPQRTLFFEDSVRNIQAGKRVGLRTVLVGTSHRVKGADYALESLHNLKEAIPELWDFDTILEVGISSELEKLAVAEKTSVTA